MNGAVASGAANRTALINFRPPFIVCVKGGKFAMSCNHCSTKFNFFHKEMGCASCNLSFCNKCLKQKVRVPSKGPGEYSVCRVCHAKITSGQPVAQPVIPPEALIKRLEALETATTSAVVTSKRNPQTKPNPITLSPVDRNLMERLENLKDAKGKPPTEAELRKRLAELKGENNYAEGPSKSVFFGTTDTRTADQKVDGLLEMFASEREIELAHNPQEELEARLASLRERGVEPNRNAYVSNLHDSSGSGSEEQVDKLTKKIMDEVALDAKYRALRPDDDDDANDGCDDAYSEELPWCVLCNKDAEYRCVECGGDLYCSECCAEAHATWERDEHRTVRYSPPKRTGN